MSQVMGQQMRMEQRLTPRLIQSMTILQKPVAELEAYIEEALESNAALEVVESEAGKPESSDGVGGPAVKAKKSERDDGFSRAERFAREHGLEWFDRSAPPRRTLSGEPDGKLAAMANAAGRVQSLQEYLLEQWSLLELENDVRAAGEAIINKLDPDGYLRVRLEEIAAGMKSPPPVEVLERALKEVQGLDPTGIGARTPVECLLLQLDALPGDNQIERTLIEHHLEDITHNRLPAVAKATGYSLGEINEAIRAIRHSLHPHPGHLVGDHSVPVIRPDVIVDYAETGGGLEVRLARGNMPTLRIRDDTAALAKSKTNNRDERDFAKRHVEEAAALIDAVNFRRTQLLDVSRAIAERQREFFDIGPAGLKVCKMSDLAEQLGCDPSTISRTVADKYMQSPRGIFPLRYFFTGGMETEGGETVGWDHVKTRVRALIDAEDKKKPLNDDQIVVLLSKEGIDISRRTVAKYRQQLDIPAARQRKQF